MPACAPCGGRHVPRHTHATPNRRVSPSSYPLRLRRHRAGRSGPTGVASSIWYDVRPRGRAPRQFVKGETDTGRWRRGTQRCSRTPLLQASCSNPVKAIPKTVPPPPKATPTPVPCAPAAAAPDPADDDGSESAVAFLRSELETLGKMQKEGLVTQAEAAQLRESLCRYPPRGGGGSKRQREAQSTADCEQQAVDGSGQQQPPARARPLCFVGLPPALWPATNPSADAEASAPARARPSRSAAPRPDGGAGSAVQRDGAGDATRRRAKCALWGCERPVAAGVRKCGRPRLGCCTEHARAATRQGWDGACDTTQRRPEASGLPPGAAAGVAAAELRCLPRRR